MDKTLALCLVTGCLLFIPIFLGIMCNYVNPETPDECEKRHKRWAKERAENKEQQDKWNRIYEEQQRNAIVVKHEYPSSSGWETDF